jgi:hypothetical protein
MVLLSPTSGRFIDRHGQRQSSGARYTQAMIRCSPGTLLRTDVDCVKQRTTRLQSFVNRITSLSVNRLLVLSMFHGAAGRVTDAEPAEGHVPVYCKGQTRRQLRGTCQSPEGPRVIILNSLARGRGSCPLIPRAVTGLGLFEDSATF